MSLQRVDPFIPVSKPTVRQMRRPVSKRQSVRVGKAIDGFMSGPQVMRQVPQPLTRPAPTQSKPRPAPAPTPPHTYTPPRPSEATAAFVRAEQQMTTPELRKGGVRRGLGILLQSFALLTLFGVGFLLRSMLVGQAIILIYALFVFILRIESRTTFMFVLISFGVVLTASLRSDTALASVFAVYAFMLLVVGTVSLGREVRNEV